MKKETILLISDTHFPYHHMDIFSFYEAVKKKYKPQQVYHLGDMVDNHAISYHESSPELKGAGDELDYAITCVETLGSIFPKMTILTGNHDCYDKETECLTRDGWKKGEDVTYEDEIGTMNLETGFMEFQKPTNLMFKDYNGEMFKYSGGAIDLLVTPNHRMVYKEKECLISDNNNYKIDRAYKLTKGAKYFPVSCDNNNTGIDLSNNHIKLAALLYTDGSFLSNNRLVFYQSKLDVVEKFKTIMSDLGIEYKENKRIRNITEISGKKLLHEPKPCYEFTFHSPILGELLNDRHRINKSFFNMNSEQAHLFIQYWILGDGSLVKNGTSGQIDGKKEILSDLQLILTNNGISSKLTEYRVSNWRLAIAFDRYNTYVNMNTMLSIKQYNGRIWCHSVPNSTLIVRRGGRVMIQGNCLPKRKARTAGLPSRYIKNNKEVFNMSKGWEWKIEEKITMIDGRTLWMKHNLTKNVLEIAKYYNCCFACGHYHESMSIESLQDYKYNVWGAICGCGVDDESLAFEYNKGNLKRPMLGCIVIKNGIPTLIRMKLDANNMWIGELE